MSNPDRPFGWRKRIGLLSPTVIETAAYDFYRLAPDGVSMCATTSNIEQCASEGAGGGRSLPKPRSSLTLHNHAQYNGGTRGQEKAGRTCPGPAQERYIANDGHTKPHIASLSDGENNGRL